jgi:hypothetical protein
MSQKNDPQKPIVEGNAKILLERLTGSVQHYDKPFEPVGVDHPSSAENSKRRP